MTEDHFQWIAIVGLFVWLIFVSQWIAETTELLKVWWSDFLRDIAAKEYRDRLEKVRGWGPKKPYTPKPLRHSPEMRGTRIEPTEPWPDPPKRDGDE